MAALAPATAAVPLVNYAHTVGGRHRVSYPVVVSDMAYGAFVFSGRGRAGVLDVHAADLRPRGTAAAPPEGGGSGGSGVGGVGSGGSGAPGGGGAPASGGAAAAAAGAVGGGLASGGIGGGGGGSGWEDGGDTDASDFAVTSAMSLATASASAAISALALDGDTLLVGLSDGTVALWRVNGMEAVSAVLAWPSMRCRPDVVLRNPGGGAGAATHVALSRDDDLAVVCYGSDVWMYELSRGRPLAALPAATAASLAGAATGACTAVAAAVAADAGVALAFVGVRADRDTGAQVVTSEVVLYNNGAAAGAASAPVARRTFAFGIASLTRLRAGCAVGDWEGAGSVLALGSSDGHVLLLDGRDLSTLAAWRLAEPVAVHSVDVSPDLAYLVAGGANGIVAAFALPAFVSTLAPDAADAAEDTFMSSLVSGAVSLGSGVLSTVETAKGAASKASAVASEVRGFFGSWMGGGR